MLTTPRGVGLWNDYAIVLISGLYSASTNGFPPPPRAGRTHTPARYAPRAAAPPGPGLRSRSQGLRSRGALFAAPGVRGVPRAPQEAPPRALPPPAGARAWPTRPLLGARSANATAAPPVRLPGSLLGRGGVACRPRLAAFRPLRRRGARRGSGVGARAARAFLGAGRGARAARLLARNPVLHAFAPAQRRAGRALTRLAGVQTPMAVHAMAQQVFDSSRFSGGGGQPYAHVKPGASAPDEVRRRAPRRAPRLRACHAALAPVARVALPPRVSAAKRRHRRVS